MPEKQQIKYCRFCQWCHLEAETQMDGIAHKYHCDYDGKVYYADDHATLCPHFANRDTSHMITICLN